ncbi:stage II sporulation protein M [Dyadobacter sp. 32]|uniref:stage II sporulation protein M n=1 Tax=Dyadobacter sp. 32 TaxID=538966 RepID=UPI0011F04CAF
MKRSYWKLVSLSALMWLLPFCLRVVFTTELAIETKNMSKAQTSIEPFEKTSHYLSKGDQYGAFLSIWKNNATVGIYNVLGGVLLGIGTILNLIMNGYITADILASIYTSGGLTIEQLAKFTLPHSIELLGIWMCSGIGLTIARFIFRYIKREVFPEVRELKGLLIYFILGQVIILVAAWLEIYVSLEL